MPRQRRLSIARHPSTAPQTPSIFKASPILSDIAAWLSKHSNFYRVHLVVFSVVPIIVAGIFYASNSSESPISWVDSMFMVYSAATVTGLNSALLGDMTTWQQVILFLCMCVGSTSFVSIIVIVIRLRFFRRKFQYLVEHDADARDRADMVGLEEARAEGREYKRIGRPTPVDALGHSAAFLSTNSAAPSPAASAPTTRDYEAEQREKARDKERERKKRKKKQERLRADMIKRVDVPVRVNEMNVTGWLAERPGNRATEGSTFDEPNSLDSSALATPSAETEEDEEEVPTSPTLLPAPASGPHKTAIQIDDSSKPDRTEMPSRRRASDSAAADLAHFRLDNMPRVRTMEPALATLSESPPPMSPTTPTARDFPRTRTIEFRDGEELRLRRTRTRQADPDAALAARRGSTVVHRDHNRTLTRTSTYQPNEAAMTTGFGGFPNPIVAAAQFARNNLPAFKTVERNLTMPRTTTLTSIRSSGPATIDARTKPVSYISFDATVGRNSRFHNLTQAQQEELGGVEYRALRLLLKIVVGYWLLSQLLAVTIVAPWLVGASKYGPVFTNPAANAKPTWFTFFNMFSAYSNNGMSLVDTSMVEFADAYLLIIPMMLLILGGNTALPVFLRLIIWTLSKLVPRQSRTRETLQFLLDHPRRCYIYLFPSHQTWFLAFLLVVLNSVDFVSFMVLDIGNPVIEAIPVGQRIADGLFQTFAVRAAGFSIVPLASVAPALQLLYVVMMYIAVYPIALSIRSSNVYESQALGIYDDDESTPEDEMEANFDVTHKATQYIGYHARKQLAFDMWWLVLAVWLICIIERGAINRGSEPEISIFTIMFEITSAYATCGLSLGTPQKNTSLVGVLGTLSKLIVIIVMVRGRHRGLPLAIDRSVMLPNELQNLQFEETESVRLARRASRSTMSARGGGLESVRPETDLERLQRQREASGDQDFGFSYTNPVNQPARGRLSESEEESSSSKASKEVGSEASEMRQLSGTAARPRQDSTMTIQGPKDAPIP